MAKNNVQLLSLLIKPNAGLEVVYTHDYKGIPIKSKDHMRADPAKELVGMLRKLAPFVMKVGPLGHFEHALDSGLMADLITTKDLPTVKKAAMQYVNKAISVRKVEFKYNEEGLRGVIITAHFSSHYDENVVMKLPMVDLEQSVYGFETGLLKNAEKLIEEAKAYMNGNFSRLPEPEEKKEAEEEEQEENDPGIPADAESQIADL